MATALAVGVMNLWWMAALTAAVFVEQVAPRGEWIRAPLGIALIAAGLLRA
jgi:predicted metal-binding membrane protein